MYGRIRVLASRHEGELRVGYWCRLYMYGILTVATLLVEVGGSLCPLEQFWIALEIVIDEAGVGCEVSNKRYHEAKSAKTTKTIRGGYRS